MHDPQQPDRISLACVQCRSRHVRCDSTQPPCGRCKRDGKECTYLASRRGGLDKAALAKRRARLRQEAEAAQQNSQQTGNTTTALEQNIPAISVGLAPDSQLARQISNERLLGLFFESFWPPYPLVLPLERLRQRMYHRPNHGIDALLPVLYWIGSIYATWVPSEPYYDAALRALGDLESTPFNVQALLLFAIGQHHCDLRAESRQTLDGAVAMALQLRMNEREFAQAYSEGDAVLAESWRRTYFFLYYVDQELAIVSRTIFFTLLNVPNTVDLPCEDEAYESGQIPTPATWQEYQAREFDEVEVVFSSIAYFHDLNLVVSDLINTLLRGGTYNEELIDNADAKTAAWLSLLPTSKKDPLRLDGTMDEVMFTTLAQAAILGTSHRSFSALAYCPEEFTTRSFIVLAPVLSASTSRRAAHTARSLKAVETYTKLWAIPSCAEKHNVFVMTIVAQMATTQISACKNLLEDHAYTIGRDRIRLSVGFLNTVGEYWPLAKQMAKEVKGIARSQLTNTAATVSANAGAEIDIIRDDLVWPMNPSTQIDIFAGTVMPMDWNVMSSGYASSASSIYNSSDHAAFAAGTPSSQVYPPSSDAI
ncbi:hypothetical protein FB567DRAFT_538792 [Paraphoma chrysanthemicola]|uniref:Zn(2)-C6 fungal-type domain-containing protein n=1 Tax=Paraphoma chrysanthemicola TaxID=798071 RepID=A0A8K0QWJ2_9PLEO|nr:hypothetical protein FB567DRAFT_538792 [Paraphoma chrysanthemicola]